MATILKNILNFTGLVLNTPASLPHRLNINDVQVAPQLGGVDTEGFIVTADEVNVTVTRTVDSPGGAVKVYVEHWHTIEEVLPLPGKLAGLTPFFFAASGQDITPIVVEDEGVALPNPPHAILNFTGTGVTATDAGGGVAEINIPGNALVFEDDGVSIGPGPFTTANLIGAGVQAADAGGGVASITVPGFLLVFRPGGVQGGNVFTSWTDLMAAAALIQGRKIIQFDDRIATPCVIPAGTWDQNFCEWSAVQNNNTGAAVAVSIGGGPSGGDVILPNLREISGKIVVTNLNAVSAPVVVTPTGATRIFFQLGLGINDGSQIVNSGAAPFFDCTGLAGPQGAAGAQQLLLRVSGQIGGTTPAIQFGASSGSLALALFEARILAGMIAGTNPLANINIGIISGSVGFSRQSGWAGLIRRGIPNQAQQATAAGFTPYVRTSMFPAPGAGGAAAPPSTVALTPATGQGMNVTMRFDATAGVIAQALPQIRAAAPAIGAQPNVVPGVLNSEGMIVIVREFSGLNGVSLTPSAGETIEGGAGPLVVPAGGSRIIQSDGVSDWRVIAGYL